MKKLTVFFLAGVAALLTACGPSPSAVSTAVAGTLRAWTAIPSQTFRPTYTFPPTQTRYPTYTRYQTSTATVPPTQTEAVRADSLNYTGTYWREKTCSLDVIQDEPGSARVSLWCTRGAPSYNSGTYDGTILLRNGKGSDTITDYGGTCVLSFAFGRNAVEVTQDGDPFACGFGHGVYADGTYMLTSRARPVLHCGPDLHPCK